MQLMGRQTQWWKLANQTETTGRVGGEDRKLSQKEAEENNWETPSGNTMASAAGARAPRRRISRQAAAS